jgi:hypothetical protein
MHVSPSETCSNAVTVVRMTASLDPRTADQCHAVLTEWAAHYPSARFVMVAIEPDGSDATVLGWGLALPDHVFAHLPAINVTGRFRVADDLVRLLSHTMNVRIIWLDLEPEHWPDD